MARHRLAGPALALTGLLMSGSAHSQGTEISASAASPVPATAKLSPDGNRAVWPLDDWSGFWFAERDASGWSAPRSFAVRGMVRDPAFSPDGTLLAFENKRGGDPTGRWNERSYEWSFIGVYDFAKSAISYVDPAFSRDSDLRWEDARTLSFTRRVEGLPDERLSRPALKADAPLKGQKATLAKMLEAATLYQPVASQDGKAFAFAGRSGAMRAIYFARAGETARPVAQYDGDDGLDLSQTAVSPDGSLVAYVRGSTLNSKGEVSNPRHFPAPPQRELWVVNTAPGSVPLNLGPGDSPRFSPDGSILAWQSARGVLKAPIVGSGGSAALGAPDVLLAGQITNLRFAPDSKRLAFQRVFNTANGRFVSERASRIEILDLSSGTLFGIARPIDADDTEPAWSPDSSQIAFLRITRGGTRRNDGGYMEASNPWEIMGADAVTGTARRIWQADPGRGSVFYGHSPDPTGNGVGREQILWSSDDRIGFIWEKDGWRHLYAIPATGGEARLLTPGDGDVEKASLSHDGTAILYAHNIGDLPGRHVSSVPFSGGAPAALADMGTNQWAPTGLAGGTVAFVDAGWTKTQTVHFRGADGATTDVGPAAPQSYPSHLFVKPTAVQFSATDGELTYGELFTPKRPTGCGIVFIHGGKERQMLLGFHYMDVYSYLYVFNQYLASRGCAVLSLEYRGSLMRGTAYRNAAGYGTSAKVSEYADFLGAAAYLRSRPELKVKRVGVYGISQGGFSTAISLGRNSDVFSVGFDMAGVHDYPAGVPESLLSSYVDTWASPILIASGDDDRTVDHGQSMLLYSELMRRKPSFEVAGRVYPNETHDLYQSIANLTDLYWDGGEFMMKHLVK